MRASARSGSPSGAVSILSVQHRGAPAASRPIPPRPRAARERRRRAYPSRRSCRPLQDPRVEEDADREQIGEDDPGALRSSSGGRAGSAGSAAGVRGDPLCERRAVEAVEPERLGGRPARGPALDAEDGHGTARERAPERVAEAADRRVVLEDEDVVEGGDLRREPVRVEAVEPRHRHDRTDSSPLSASSSAASSASWSITGPYGTAPRRLPRAARCPGRRVARAEARSAAARADREPQRDASRRASSTAQRRAPGLLPRARLDDRRRSGAPRAARCRGRSGATCPGPAGMRPA